MTRNISQSNASNYAQNYARADIRVRKLVQKLVDDARLLFTTLSCHAAILSSPFHGESTANTGHYISSF